MTLLLTIAILLLADFSSAHAQAKFGNFGIETPAQRFFREGREQLEEETRRLQTPEDASAGLLTIDRDVDPQENLLRMEDPRFHSQPSPLPGDSVAPSETRVH